MVNVNQADNYIETAASDARTCELLLPNYREVPNSVCFHAEQCAEKLLKQVFVDNGDVPPRSHDLTVILKEIYELGYLHKDIRLSQAAMFLQIFPTKARYVPFEDAECGEALTAVIHCNRLSAALSEQGYEGETIETTARFLADVEREGAEPPLAVLRTSVTLPRETVDSLADPALGERFDCPGLDGSDELER